MTDQTLLQIQDLRVHYPIRQGLRLPGQLVPYVHAVDGISLDIQKGEILALVGESGCGKTTFGKAVLRLASPAGGKILYAGEDLASVPQNRMRRFRQKMQMIFQDPYESLDARQSIYDTLAEPLLIHQRIRAANEGREQIFAALKSAGLYPPEEIARRYPHHLSGGQRQRVAIAATMILEPEFIVADEPVSMLDVSIRAEILRLMLDLRVSHHLTYLFITHDLSLAWVIADRIAVLYLGKLVELGPANEIIHHPHHPYTRSLVSVIPSPTPGHEKQKIILKGETPSPIHLPTGCRFHHRCWLYQKQGAPKQCVELEPALTPLGENQLVACHYSQGETHDRT